MLKGFMNGKDMKMDEEQLRTIKHMVDNGLAQIDPNFKIVEVEYVNNVACPVCDNRFEITLSEEWYECQCSYRWAKHGIHGEKHRTEMERIGKEFRDKMIEQFTGILKEKETQKLFDILKTSAKKVTVSTNKFKREMQEYFDKYKN